MRGLLTDENIGGFLAPLRRRIAEVGLLSLLENLDIEFATFNDLSLPPGLDDRPLWEYCQQERWVLLTDNRNSDDKTSLGATLSDSWKPGCLPVITIGDKSRFDRDDAYAERVAAEVAELLFGIRTGQYCDQPRIFVPR